MQHKDIHGVPINDWDIIAIAQNDAVHVGLVVECSDYVILVKVFRHKNTLGYTSYIVSETDQKVVSLMTSPVHVDMWNIRRELMNG